MRILIESEDEMYVVETRKAGAFAGESGTDEVGEPAADLDQGASDGQTYDAGAAPVGLHVEPSASEDDGSDLIDVGGFQAR